MPPSAALAAASAAVRLDDAVRGFLTEQGSKRLRKEDLWTLVNASSRLRLTAYTLAGLRHGGHADGAAAATSAARACRSRARTSTRARPACIRLRSVTAGLAGFYDAIADEVSRPGSGQLSPVPLPAMVGPAMPRPEPVTAGSKDRTGADSAGQGRGHRARAPAAAPAPALGPGAPAPPERQRPDGERAGAARRGNPPAPLVAVARPALQYVSSVAMVSEVTHARLPGEERPVPGVSVRELSVRPGRSHNVDYGQ